MHLHVGHRLLGDDVTHGDYIQERLTVLLAVKLAERSGRIRVSAVSQA